MSRRSFSNKVQEISRQHLLKKVIVMICFSSTYFLLAHNANHRLYRQTQAQKFQQIIIMRNNSDDVSSLGNLRRLIFAWEYFGELWIYENTIGQK